MDETLIVQGRRLGGPELEKLRGWVSDRAAWSRRRLSVELAAQWEWRNGAGQLKDMAARTLLLKLHQRGLLELPPRRQAPTNRMRCARPELPMTEAEPPAVIECSLAELGSLQVHEVSRDPAGRAWVKGALARDHYLGFNGAVGENLQYIVSDSQGRRLACVVFSAAAWKCQDRDELIGWSAAEREKNLGLGRQQHALSDLALGSRALPGQLDPGPDQPAPGPRVAGQVRAFGGAAGDLCGTAALCWHGLSCGQLAARGTNQGTNPAGSAYLHSSGGEGYLCLSAVLRLPEGAARVKTPEELLREFANNAAGLAEYAARLQERFAFQAQQLAEAQRERDLKEQQLAEARAIIAELKRELFGARADKLNPEQEAQLQQLLGDTQEQNERRPPISREVLQETLAQERSEQRQSAKDRPRRQLPPVELEKQQVILEPQDKLCPVSGQERPRIGQEVTTEYAYFPPN